jgi:hypothetical protein
MWRYCGEPVAEQDATAFERAGVAVRLVTKDLQTVLDVVDPQACPDAFGPRIHQLLLTACSEVEAAWAGVLRANAYPARPRLDTNDYVLLAGPMRLSDYRILLEGYPAFPEIRPFLGWDLAKPTQSLDWYDAHNAVKQDRELNATRGSLRHLISACGAVVVMATAQFGQDAFLPEGKFGQRTLHLHGVAAFQQHEVYRPPTEPHNQWVPTNYSFHNAAA